MASNTIHVSDELLAELKAKAEAAGKTVDELADEALRKGLEERAWQDLVAYGRRRVKHLDTARRTCLAS